MSCPRLLPAVAVVAPLLLGFAAADPVGAGTAAPDAGHPAATDKRPSEAVPSVPTGVSVPAGQSANGFPDIKPVPYFRVVPKGESRAIGFFPHLFPDCTSQGPVVARLTGEPKHGSVTFEQTESFPRYAPGTPLGACNVKKVPGVKLIYTAEDGYEGLDAFGVQLINPDGTVTGLDVKVSIR